MNNALNVVEGVLPSGPLSHVALHTFDFPR